MIIRISAQLVASGIDVGVGTGSVVVSDDGGLTVDSGAVESGGEVTEEGGGGNIVISAVPVTLTVIWSVTGGVKGVWSLLTNCTPNVWAPAGTFAQVATG